MYKWLIGNAFKDHKTRYVNAHLILLLNLGWWATGF
jgi:hypothetical protein